MIKYLSLFSGIGSFEKAFNNLNIDVDLVGYSEIDKFASKSYSLIHGVSEDKNLGDITKIDEDSLPGDIDLITYGFPCQDISISGKGAGLINSKGQKTRSGLMFDAIRIIDKTQPKIAIAENVKNFVSEKFKKEFDVFLNLLDIDYNNYYQVLNARDYGMPQNRERVFIISIRKDVDNYGFKFPKKTPFNKHVSEFLEKNVEEKYFLSEEQLYKINNSSYDQQRNRIQTKKYCDCLTAHTTCVPVFKTSEEKNNKTSYRNITPKESFKLMGFTNEDFDILKKNKISNTQLYKQAGNSIVVNAAEEILKSLIKYKLLNNK